MAQANKIPVITPRTPKKTNHRSQMADVEDADDSLFNVRCKDAFMRLSRSKVAEVEEQFSKILQPPSTCGAWNKVLGLNPENETELTEMIETMAELYSQPEIQDKYRIASEDLKVGSIVCSAWKDGFFCRAEIVSIYSAINFSVLQDVDTHRVYTTQMDNLYYLSSQFSVPIGNSDYLPTENSLNTTEAYESIEKYSVMCGAPPATMFSAKLLGCTYEGRLIIHQDDKEYKQMIRSMAQFFSASTTKESHCINVEFLTVGSLICSEGADGSFYRAKILAIDPLMQFCSVMNIDTCECHAARFDNIFLLPIQYWMVPKGFECNLEGLEELQDSYFKRNAYLGLVIARKVKLSDRYVHVTVTKMPEDVHDYASVSVITSDNKSLLKLIIEAIGVLNAYPTTDKDSQESLTEGSVSTVSEQASFGITNDVTSIRVVATDLEPSAGASTGGSEASDGATISHQEISSSDTDSLREASTSTETEKRDEPSTSQLKINIIPFAPPFLRQNTWRKWTRFH